MGKKFNHTNSKGITIIALAITVVILLILAGVSINQIIGDKSTIKSIESGVNKFEIEEDKDIISEIRKEVSIKNVGEIPLDNLESLLGDRRFPAFSDVEEYNGKEIGKDELVVGCPHGDHSYLVSGDKIEPLPYNIKAIPVIEFSNEIVNKDGTITFDITITCEGGLKSIQLPNEESFIEDLEADKIKRENIKSVVINKSLTEITIKGYTVSQSGKYTFKATSKGNVTRKNTKIINTLVPSGDNITIAYTPTEDTNKNVKVTISKKENLGRQYYIEYQILTSDSTNKIKGWTRYTGEF